MKLVEFYSPTTNEKMIVNCEKIAFLECSEVYANATNICFTNTKYLIVKGGLDEISKRIQE